MGSKIRLGFPGGVVVMNPLPKQETQEIWVQSPVPGRSTGGGNGKPLQYSCVENPMFRGAWQATVHQIAQSWTHLSIHAQEKTTRGRNINQSTYK